MDEIQKQIFKDMSPQRKLEVAMQLYHSARELKEAGIRSLHTNWNEKQVQEALREAFLYART